METMDINQPLDNINIVELCRACFETCGQYKLLFEDAEGIEKRSMGDVFSDVAKIEMKTNTESSPNRICLPCSKDLISAYKFIRKSQLNNNRLLEYLKNSSSIKQPDCLSEFPIDIPTDTNTADFLQIKVENEAISEYAEPLEDKISPPSSSDSAGSDYDDSPLHEEEKVNKLQCTYCNRIFKRMDFFQSHKRKHEEELKKRVNMDLNTDETGESSSAFLCDECGIGCATKFELKSHRLANHTTRENFTAAQTKLLISTRLKYEKAFASGKKSKPMLWGQILSDMKQEQPYFNFSKSQIQRKFLNIMITFKRIKNRNKGTGRDATTWEHFEPLDEVYGTKYSIEPPIENLETSSHLPDDQHNQEESSLPPTIKEDLSDDDDDAEVALDLDQVRKRRTKRRRIPEKESLDFLREESKKDDKRHQEMMELERQKLETEKERIKEMRDLKEVMQQMLGSTRTN